MKLDILTPEKSLFSGEATAVQFPGSDGLFQVLNHHAPMIATLIQGTIVIQTSTGSERIAIKGGVVEVAHNTLSVLAH